MIQPLPLWNQTSTRQTILDFVAAVTTPGSCEPLNLNLLLHQDGAEREYAQGQGAERALQLAGERGWTIVSMKNDRSRVFAFEDLG